MGNAYEGTYDDPTNPQPHLRMKRVIDLRPGDLVDLEGDPFADEGDHPEFEYEYAEVLILESGTAECVRVDFDGLSVGFPPDHLVPVVPRVIREETHDHLVLIEDPQGRTVAAWGLYTAAGARGTAPILAKMHTGHTARPIQMSGRHVPLGQRARG